MAENKKSFVLYADLIHTVVKMPDNKAGELFKHILKYVNDKNPQTEDLIIQLTFEPIKQQLKRDLLKYESKKQQWSDAGKRSAESRKLKKNQRALTNVEKRSTDLTVSDSVSVSVNEIIDKSITYTEKDFLINWNQLRTHYLKTPSNLNSLKQDEGILFNDINNPFSKDEYHLALHGLFKQEVIPKEIMVFKPKHFLGNIDTYLDAEKNKKYNLYK